MGPLSDKLLAELQNSEMSSAELSDLKSDSDKRLCWTCQECYCDYYKMISERAECEIRDENPCPGCLANSALGCVQEVLNKSNIEIEDYEDNDQVVDFYLPTRKVMILLHDEKVFNADLHYSAEWMVDSAKERSEWKREVFRQDIRLLEYGPWDYKDLESLKRKVTKDLKINER